MDEVQIFGDRSFLKWLLSNFITFVWLQMLAQIGFN